LISPEQIENENDDEDEKDWRMREDPSIPQ
jgi:hypothetical protein